MIGTSNSVRVLGPGDLSEALEVFARDPVANVFAEFRARLTSLDPRWMGGEMWGYAESGRLVALCHNGANLVPVQATPRAAEAFADRAAGNPRRSSTIVGPSGAVRTMWGRLERAWGRPREARWDQPHLQIADAPAVRPDRRVRRTMVGEVEQLYPACVAMYTEEVGVSPEIDGGRDLYHARVLQLVNRGWSFSRIEDGEVLFKAEVACATSAACQVQGVYVSPSHRGQGIGTAGMAAVVDACLREIAPVVSLYVNAHNAPARAAYARVGFEQAGTFSTIMY